MFQEYSSGRLATFVRDRLGLHFSFTWIDYPEITTYLVLSQIRPTAQNAVSNSIIPDLLITTGGEEFGTGPVPARGVDEVRVTVQGQQYLARADVPYRYLHLYGH